MDLFKNIFFNSWIKALFFIAFCILATYLLINNFWQILTTFVDWRNKKFWMALGVIGSAMFLLPTFMNMMFFVKIIQIADNTKKTEELLTKQIELFNQILQKK
ncbi:MAG: hypothetical protein ACRCVW_02975 [Brevinema sp.]